MLVHYGANRTYMDTPLSRVSEVLNRRRNLSLNMIRNLHSQLHIPLESLIGVSGQHA